MWGLGPHALKNILPAIKGALGLQLSGVYSRNTEVVASVSKDFGCRSWEAADLMLEDREVDVIYLSTPIGLHASQGEAVLQSGKHLWCEKPLCRNSEEVATLTSLARERGYTVAEGFMYLYHPQFSYLQTVLKSGRLGYIQGVTCRFGIPPLARPGFRNSDELGGGAFLDVGSYPISAMVSLFPHTRPEVSFSDIEVEPGSPVDTTGTAILRCDGGVRATLEWGVGSSYRNEIDVWGTDGSVSSERVFSKQADYVPRFRFLDRMGRESFELGERANHFAEMLAAFRAFIDNEAAAEQERKRIERCAALMDAVREHSTS